MRRALDSILPSYIEAPAAARSPRPGFFSRSSRPVRPSGQPRRLASYTKVSKTYRLAPARIAAAQKILGTSTATETLEMALDLLVFRRELLDGTRALFGLAITSPDKA